MSTTRRRSATPSTTSSLEKRPSENVVKPGGAANLAKKRPPLANLTNQKLGQHLVPCSNKISKTSKGAGTILARKEISIPRIVPTVKPTAQVVLNVPAVPVRNENFPLAWRRDGTANGFTGYGTQPAIDRSPYGSDDVSMDDSMSYDSFKSPAEVFYLDNDEDVSAVNSTERKTFGSLCLWGHTKPQDEFTSVDVAAEPMLTDLDNSAKDPQLCASYACDIYNHLREVETKKRPSTDFMEKVQKDINSSMRSILIDWLVEVAEEYRLVSDTLYLTVNYIDRYLSGNAMNRQKLQLLGVACMMIAAKYEEICAPQVEEFCYITDNTYFREEVLQMESSVLNYLKFEMTAATSKCFLRRFVRAAEGTTELPSLQLECLANYIAELSLLEYDMLRYAPSLIAASSIFLAKYVLNPIRRPWDSTLVHYTKYQPSKLHGCVKALHHLYCESPSSSLPAIREKYSQHKFKCVAKKFCPSTIPSEFFHNLQD